MAEKTPPRPPPKPNDPDIGKEVFINCRARAKCPGRSAVMTMKFKLPAGGVSLRYRCTTCNGTFHITR